MTAGKRPVTGPDSSLYPVDARSARRPEDENFFSFIQRGLSLSKAGLRQAQASLVIQERCKQSTNLEFKLMQTEILSAKDPDAITTTAAAARQGRLVVIPTDTVYGVGCTVTDDSVIRRLYAAKLRPLDKAIPVLLADPDALPQIVTEVSSTARTLIERFWPGPLTLVLPKRPDLPPALSPTDTVAVRIPDHPVARQVIAAAGGAMAVTSANASGAPPAQTAAAAHDQLAGRVSIVLDDGRAPVGVASTVALLSGAELRILRPGPLSLDDLVAAL